MTSATTPELISFKLCPFVQRSAITLNEKSVSFKTTYVDLQDLPDWFADVSPLGKVPVLRMGNAILFESAVIAEYLDERYSPMLHPDNLLKKAQHRSWTEFASDITMNMFKMLHAKTDSDFNALKEKVVEQFAQVEKEIDPQGPFFDGDFVSLVDASYAPIFLRLHLVDQVYPLNIFAKTGRIADWSKALLKRDSVIQSVVDDFDDIFMAYSKNSGGFLSQQIA